MPRLRLEGFPPPSRSPGAVPLQPLLALLDQLAHALTALLADLLVEAGAALGLDGVAALLADLLVEGAAALGLDRLAALLADLFVEGMAVLVAHRLTSLASRFAHAHRALLLRYRRL